MWLNKGGDSANPAPWLKTYGWGLGKCMCVSVRVLRTSLIFLLVQFVVGLGEKVAPTDIEEGMRVGYVLGVQ